jgi:hypothetical protein
MSKGERISQFVRKLDHGDALAAAESTEPIASGDVSKHPYYRAYFVCWNEQRYYEAHDVCRKTSNIRVTRNTAAAYARQCDSLS